jgi:hypothetical protein
MTKNTTPRVRSENHETHPFDGFLQKLKISAEISYIEGLSNPHITCTADSCQPSIL